MSALSNVMNLEPNKLEKKRKSQAVDGKPAKKLKGESLSASKSTQKEEKKIIVLLTSHWGKDWFTKLILPASRYVDYNKENFIFVETADFSFDENFETLRKLILAHRENAVVVAVTDVTMQLYSTVVESLKGAAYCPTGANFHCFFLATNKLANRKLVPRCAHLKSTAVTSDMEYLPDLGVTGFFKPLEGVASEGVMVVPTGGTKTKNPLFGEKNSRGGSEIIAKLANSIPELLPYLDEKIVGLVEEYISLKDRVSTVSIDGYICNGKVQHYTISDNIYKADEPEVFDSLVTPTQRLSKQEQQQCWDLYDEVVSAFLKRGLNNQFIDVEAFFLKGGRLEVMEVNCRSYSNMLPGFARVYGKNCMFSAMLDLLKGKDPKYETSTGLSKNRKCVATYVPCVPNVPDVIEFTEGDTWGAYYSPPDRSIAHVYYYTPLESEAVARKRCDEVYAKVKKMSKTHVISRA